jgi:hypothetical protein
MSSPSLSNATHALIASYGNTAKNVINAYRWGNARAASYVEKTWITAVHNAGKRISGEVRANALTAQKKLTGYYVQGVTLTTDTADTAVNKMVELTGKGLEQVATNASRFERATGVQALRTLASASVPAVVAVHTVASKLEAKSGDFAARIAGFVAKKPVKTSAARAQRAATPKVRKAAPRVRKTPVAPEVSVAA